MSAIPRQAAAPALRLAEVAKSFPRRRSVGELVRRPFASRGRVPAVRGVSFEVGRSEILGLLGPNGAGKTTLLKIICGLIVPDRGRVEVFGEQVSGPRLSRQVGLVHGDERSFYWRLTARENLDFFARLYGLGREDRERLIARLLEKVGLSAEADRRFGDFSSGMRQRLSIARGLLADPPILLMDEPTRSLDPVTAASLREFVTEELHRGDGKAVLIATHNLREAEMLCHRVVVLAEGRVRAADTPDALRRMGLGGLAYRLRLGGLDRTPEGPGWEELEKADSGAGTIEVVLRLESEPALDRLLEAVRRAGGSVLHCGPEERALEDVFRALVAPAGADEDDR